MGGHPLVTSVGHSYIARPTCRRRAPTGSGTRGGARVTRLALEVVPRRRIPPKTSISRFSGCGIGGDACVSASYPPRKETPCMTTLFLLAVLGAGDVATTPTTPESAWLSDYGEGLKRAKQLQKPLLVVIDMPSNAVARVEQVSHNRDGDAELLKNYVLCRVDASTKYGQAVAQAFEAGTVPYTSIIDNRGETILYWKQGQWTADEWTNALSYYR